MRLTAGAPAQLRPQPRLHRLWHSRCLLPSRLQSRGNQRDVDRARAQKRKERQGVTSKDKQAADGLTPAQRKERDAKALQEKAARKAAQASGKK